MIRFTCEHCSRNVRVADKFGGKKGRCPYCKEVIEIPAQSEPEPIPEDDPVAGLAAALGGDDAEAAIALAEAEGLDAHANSVRIRLQS